MFIPHICVTVEVIPLKLFVDMLSSSFTCNAICILPLSLPCKSIRQPFIPLRRGSKWKAAVRGECRPKVEYTSPCTYIVHWILPTRENTFEPQQRREVLSLDKICPSVSVCTASTAKVTDIEMWSIDVRLTNWLVSFGLHWLRNVGPLYHSIRCKSKCRATLLSNQK